MAEYQIRKRHRLQNKGIRALSKRLNDIFSMDFNIIQSSIDSAVINKFDVLIIDNELLGILIDGDPFLTIRGILKFQPKTKFVTVDMGAVKFLSNGADVMVPGIIDADENIENNDLVWIRDEKNLKPLAIGRTLMTGRELVQSTTGKGIISLHYIGDILWNIKI